MFSTCVELTRKQFLTTNIDHIFVNLLHLVISATAYNCTPSPSQDTEKTLLSLAQFGTLHEIQTYLNRLSKPRPDLIKRLMQTTIERVEKEGGRWGCMFEK